MKNKSGDGKETGRAADSVRGAKRLALGLFGMKLDKEDAPDRDPSSGKSRSNNAGKGRGAKRGDPGRNSDNAARIQDVALDLFAQRSFSAVTIKDIGQATGLNTAMIYYYFRDKEDLFRGAVEVAVRRSIAAFEARQAKTGDPEEILANWLETHIEQIDLIRKFVKVSLDYANSGRRIARIDTAIGDFYAYEREVLGTAIRNGIAKKIFVQRDPEPLVNFISTYLDGVMLRSSVLPDFDAAGAIRRFRFFLLEQLRREPPKYA